MRILALSALLVLACPAVPGATSQPSGCPLDLTAVAGANGTVALHWVGFGGAEGYQVFGFQGEGDTAAYSPMLSGDARDLTTTSLAPGTYTFFVSAFHSGTVVASSCERSVSVGGVLSAACPTNVTASAGVVAIGLHWDAVPNATGYRIARQADSASVDDNYGTSTTTSFVDTNVTPGGTYSYRVISQNTREPPEACGSVSATVPGGAVPYFPSGWSVALAAGGGVVAVVALRARRGEA